jgi:arabinofuranosyltransferase
VNFSVVYGSIYSKDYYEKFRLTNFSKNKYMIKFLPGSLRLIFAAFLITFIGAVFTYKVHDPKIGIDDANITQTYAKNIANGFGYVYNEGGERVEGSTSFLWTMLNVPFFTLSNSPEQLIAIFCFFLTALTIRELLLFLKHCSHIFELNFSQSIFISGGLLLANPSFFAWSIWALMDTTIWILCYSTILCRLLLAVLVIRSDAPNSGQIIPYSLLILLPIVRPEGIAISLGLIGLLIVYAHLNQLKNFRLQLITIFLLTSIVVAVSTAFRMHYFGFPLPNTFYAKVSISYIDQIIAGLKYLYHYLLNPTTVVILLLAFSALVAIFLRRTLILKNLHWFLLLFVSAVLGVFLVYVVLGGDHFGSARQFQVLSPLLTVFATLCILITGDVCLKQMYVRDAGLGKTITLSIMIFIASIFTLPNIAKYYKHGGFISNEFRIAEQNRRLGEILNQLPELPSIGVTGAGGISRAYKGHIYDMMGLNWVEMAHANRKHNKSANKNHAAFDKQTFYRNMPIIVLPSFGLCKNPSISEWHNDVLDGLLNDQKFLKNYQIACYQGTLFYVRHDWYDKWNGYLSIPN